MANSVDPDQTAPSGAVWSGSALFACVILSETLVFEFLGLYHITNVLSCTDKKNIDTLSRAMCLLVETKILQIYRPKSNVMQTALKTFIA